MASATTIGDTIRLADGQLQSPVLITLDDGSQIKDHLSYPAGNTLAENEANLATRCRQRLALAQKQEQVKLAPLPAVNTVLDLAVPMAVVEPPTKEEQERQAVLADVAAFNRSERLSRYPQDLQDRIVAAGVEGIV